MSFLRRLALTTSSLALLSIPPTAQANERHFTFTYESAVLPKNAREIEVWTTPRIGRDAFFVQFDQRIEFEVGVTDRLLTAFYLNATAANAEVAPDVRQSTFEFEGVSSEWKLKLKDPVADGLGLALYGEASGGPGESELEAKLILDKQSGHLLLAANVVGAQEWKYDEAKSESEQEAELDLGATYFFRPGFAAGLELRNHNAFHEGDWEHSALFAGPVLAYGAEGWWVAASVLPQLPALKKEEGGNGRVLDELEKVNARILFSFHL